MQPMGVGRCGGGCSAWRLVARLGCGRAPGARRNGEEAAGRDRVALVELHGVGNGGAVGITHVMGVCARRKVHADTACAPAPTEGLSISAKAGTGLQALRAELLRIAGWQSAPEGVFIARERHLRALRAVDEHLQQAQAQIDARVPALDLLAEELRLAHEALGEITGQMSADDLLGRIFSSFCIGK